MRHKLNLNLTGEEEREKVVGVRRVTLRERLARLVFGKPARFTVVVPGDSVEEVTITQKHHNNDDDDNLMALADAIGVTRKRGERP